MEGLEGLQGVLRVERSWKSLRGVRRSNGGSNGVVGGQEGGVGRSTRITRGGDRGSQEGLRELGRLLELWGVERGKTGFLKKQLEVNDWCTPPFTCLWPETENLMESAYLQKQ